MISYVAFLAAGLEQYFLVLCSSVYVNSFIILVVQILKYDHFYIPHPRL
jgi:hypothetical protein